MMVSTVWAGALDAADGDHVRRLVESFIRAQAPASRAPQHRSWVPFVAHRRPRVEHFVNVLQGVKVLDEAGVQGTGPTQSPASQIEPEARARRLPALRAEDAF